MERTRWTDDLIDERMAAIDKTFDRQLEETRALREEMHSGFSLLRAEMRALQQRMDAGFADLRGEIGEVRRDLSALQRHVTLIVAGFAAGLLGLLGAGQL